MFHLQGSLFKTLPTLPKLKCYLIRCNNQVVTHGSITIQWVNNPQWINQKKLDFCGLLHKIIRTLSPYYSRGDSVNQGVTKLSISFVWQACHFIVPKIEYFSSFYPSDHNLYKVFLFYFEQQICLPTGFITMNRHTFVNMLLNIDNSFTSVLFGTKAKSWLKTCLGIRQLTFQAVVQSYKWKRHDSLVVIILFLMLNSSTNVMVL